MSKESSIPLSVVPTRRVHDHAMTYAEQYLTCKRCGEEITFRCGKGGQKPPGVIKKIAEKHGWKVDFKGGNLCPKHAATKAKPKKELTMANKTNEAPKTATTPPEQPGERSIPTRLRRDIFRAIDDAYDDANMRYVDPSITDHTIAAELNTTWGWVARVREENFGPAGPSPEVLKLIEAVKAAKERVAKLEADAMEAAATAERLGKELTKLAEKAEGLS